MEMKHNQFKRAHSLVKQSTNQHVGISKDDVAFKVKSQLQKCIKIWNLYTDLEESLGSIDSVKAVYNRMLELKIATPLTIVNYANFLQENLFYEESFRVFERGVSLFSWPALQDIYLLYIKTFIGMCSISDWVKGLG